MADKLSVLLIEDDVLDVEAVERALKTVNPRLFKLTNVAKFRDAIRIIQSEDFHVVLLDLGLPDSVGLNGVERLMKLLPTVPVIVLTGVDDEDTSLKAIGLGAQEFLDKNSVTPKELIRKIRHATKRKQYAIEQDALLKSRRGERVDAKAELLAVEHLSSILEDTSEMMTSHTSALLKTELTEQQRTIVSEIEETTQKSLKAARTANRSAANTTAAESPPSDAGKSDTEPNQDPPPIVGRLVED